MKHNKKDKKEHHPKKVTKREREVLEQIERGEEPNASAKYMEHLVLLGLLTVVDDEYELTSDAIDILDEPDPMEDPGSDLTFDPPETFDTPDTGDGFSPGDF